MSPEVVVIISANTEWQAFREIAGDVEPGLSPFGERLGSIRRLCRFNRVARAPTQAGATRRCLCRRSDNFVANAPEALDRPHLAWGQ